jgi:uncharacterized domain 1
MEHNNEKESTKKQNVSCDCFVCGINNPASLRAKFYEVEGNEVVAVFTLKDMHQSYPNRAHGGVIAAILDETIGRCMMVEDPGTWGVTVELELKYRKPVPLNEELKAVGRIVSNSKRVFEGEGEILLSDGQVAATAHGKYIKNVLWKK